MPKNISYISNGCICSDDLWDLSITWHSAVPDFTQCFQQVLVLTVTSCFSIAAVVNLLIRSKPPPGTALPWTPLIILKMALAVTLIINSIIELSFMLYRRNMGFKVPKLEYSVSCVKIITFIFIILTLRHNKNWGFRSSTFLSTFLFFFCLSSVVTYRSSLLKVFSKGPLTFSSASNLVHFPVVFCQFLLSFFRDPFCDPPKEVKNPIEDSNILSYLTFHWFTGYVNQSAKRALAYEDFQVLPDELKAYFLRERFRIWEEKILTNRKKRNTLSEAKAEIPIMLHLIWTLCKAFWPWFICSTLLQITYSFILYFIPWLLSNVITFIRLDDFGWKGIFYCLSLFIIKTIARIISNLAKFYSSCFGMQIKTIFNIAVLQKLRSSSHALWYHWSEEHFDHITTDIENLELFFAKIFLVFGWPIKIILAVLLLWWRLGPSCLTGVAILLALVVTLSLISHKIRTIQENSIKIKNTRMKYMSKQLDDIVALKLYSWEKPCMSKISKIKRLETQLIQKFLFLKILTHFVWDSVPVLVAIASFLTFIFVNNLSLWDAELIFVSVYIMNILKTLVLEILEFITKLDQVKMSLGRLHAHLISIKSEDFLQKKQFHNGTTQNNDISSVNETGTGSIDICFRFPKASIISIVSSGSNHEKLALFASIVKPMNTVNDVAHTKDAVVYVPQNSWIIRSSLKKNVLFGKPFDKSRYDSVLNCCHLRSEFASLSGKDNENIRIKRINLTDGQKQKIGLARAVYRDAVIYVFDNPLKDVNADVAACIFEKVLGKNGLLKDETRIFFTHDLSILKSSDLIIAVKNNIIQRYGSYNDFIEADGVCVDFVTEQLLLSKNFYRYTKSSMDVQNTTKKLSMTQQRFSRKKAKYLAHNATTGNYANEDNDVEMGEVEKGSYLNYAKGMRFFLVSCIICGTLVVKFCEIGANAWLSRWNDFSINGIILNPQRDKNVAIYVVFGCLQAIVAIFSSLCLALGAAEASKLLHSKMLQRLLNAAISLYGVVSHDDIRKRFGRDMEVVDVEIPLRFCIWFLLVFSLIGAFIVILTITPLFFVFLIIIGGLFYVIQKMYMTTYQQLRNLSQSSKNSVRIYFTATIRNMLFTKSSEIENELLREAEAKIDTNNLYKFYKMSCKRWLEFHLGLLGDLVILIASILAVESKANLSDGTVGFSLLYALLVPDILMKLTDITVELRNNFTSVGRIQQYLSLPQEVKPVFFSEVSPLKIWPKGGKLKLRNLSTGSEEGIDLRNINLTIESGEKVYIVGWTSIEKLYFVLALFRLTNTIKGSIRIDDVDISSIDVHVLRSALSFIPSDPNLFNGSLRTNLDPNDIYTDHELWNSLEKTHLKSFVSTISEGLYFEVDGDDKKNSLNIGQRRFMHLAKALLKKPKILIINESATTSDEETERHVEEVICTYFKECTVIRLTNYLNVIQNGYRIIHVRPGGTFDDKHPVELTKKADFSFHTLERMMTAL